MESARGSSPLASRWETYRPAGERGPRPANLEIRPAGPGDCPAIAAIEASRDGGTHGPARRRCEAQVADADTLLLVALVDDHAVGFARAGRITRVPDAPEDAMPEGWYLLGVVVVDAWRRHGIGHALTDRRIAWMAERTDAAYYFTNARNQVSIDLHRALGFEEVTRRFSGRGIAFEGGEGILCRLDLTAPDRRAGGT